MPCRRAAAAMLALAAAGAALLTPHPRLLATAEVVAKLRAAVAAGDPTLGRYQAGLLKHVGEILPQPPVVPPPPGAVGILPQVRVAIDRLATLALAYQLTGNVTWAERAVLELNCITTWATWNNVQHTLDTGEAIAGVSLALDWLWSALIPAARERYVAALVTLGLEPMWIAFTTRPASWAWWIDSAINWNCVCSGGAMIGALLLADEPAAPAYVTNGSLLALASSSFRVCASDYAGDSSYAEGPMYWGYQSLYYVLAVASLESAGAPLDGLDDMPGANATARWEQAAQGVAGMTATQQQQQPPPAQGGVAGVSAPPQPRVGLGQSQAQFFNWADAELSGVNLAHALWFARRYQDAPTAAWLQAQYDPAVAPGVEISELSWMQPALLMLFSLGLPPVGPGDRTALPLSAVYPAHALVYSRSAWADPTASFFAAKGGNTTFTHNDLDVGTYVLDLRGQRFVSDLGADNYALPGYFDVAQRWTYYRKMTRGHNVPMFDGRNQSYAPVHNPVSGWQAPGDGSAIAVIDATAVYAGLAALNRTFAFTPHGQPVLSVCDHFSYAPGFAPSNLTVAVHTLGNVTLGPAGSLSALVTVGGVTARYYVADAAPCRGAVMTATPVQLAPPQLATDGLTRIDVLVPTPVAAGCGAVTTAWQLQA